MKKTSKALLTILTAGILVFALSSLVFASGSGMPWEGPIDKITTSIQGPVAKGIGICMIVLTSIGYAKSEHGEMLKNFFGICIALSLAFTAGSFLLPFLGFSGGIGF
ncbi:MAG: TrbC/VirB2 family protein [Bacteroidota bacterium]